MNAQLTLAPLADIPRKEEGAMTTFFVHEMPYASVALEGETLHVRVRKPGDLDKLEPMLTRYQETIQNGQAWLLLTLPANTHPGPAMQAGLGWVAGRIIRQLSADRARRSAPTA
jgi:hypothetical protein